jgi:hypothetical protein
MPDDPALPLNSAAVSPAARPTKGVVLHEPGAIAASVNRQLADIYATLPADADVALLGAHTTHGTDAVFVVRGPKGWDVATWIGKHPDGVDGGFAVRKTWNLRNSR